MPLASVTLPISPPRASISRTICPLATPPIAGLQLIWATVSAFMVRRAVRIPIGADDNHVEFVNQLSHEGFSPLERTRTLDGLYPKGENGKRPSGPCFGGSIV